MKFMVILKATADPEAGRIPSPKHMEAMIAFNEQLGKDGVLLAAEGLRASSKGMRLRFDGGRTTVTDGPSADTKELVAGFWIRKASRTKRSSSVSRACRSTARRRVRERGSPEPRVAGGLGSKQAPKKEGGPFPPGDSLARTPAWQGARVPWANRAVLALGSAIRRSPLAGLCRPHSRSRDCAFYECPFSACAPRTLESR